MQLEFGVKQRKCNKVMHSLSKRRKGPYAGAFRAARDAAWAVPSVDGCNFADGDVCMGPSPRADNGCRYTSCSNGRS